MATTPDFQIQIKIPALKDMVRGWVQEIFNNICIDPFMGIYFDHIDVVDIGDLALNGSRAGVLNVDVAIFVVSSQELETSANRSPPGASAPILAPLAPRFTLAVSLSDQWAVPQLFTLVCTAATDPDDKRLATIASDIQNAIDTLFSVDLGLLNNVGSMFKDVWTNSQSQLQVAGESLAVSWSDLGINPPNNDSLLAGQDWGIAVNKHGVVHSVSGLLADLEFNLSDGATHIDHTETWTPTATGAPHVNAVFTWRRDFSAGLGIYVSMTATATYRVNFELTSDAKLHLVWDWTLDVSVGEGQFLIPGTIDAWKAFVQNHLDPANMRPGGTKRSAWVYDMSFDLPILTLADVQLPYTSIVMASDTLVLGGKAIGIAHPYIDTFGYTVTSFPPDFTKYLSCHGRTPSPSISDTASVTFSGFTGRICSQWSQEAPAQSDIDLSGFIFVASNAITCTLGTFICAILNSLNLHVQIIIRTSRGVRFIDFGVPPAVDGDLDNPKNIHIALLDDCVGPLAKRWIPLRYWQLKWLPDPPPPDWQERVADVDNFKVSLFTVEGVERGETVIAHLPNDGGFTIVAADARGRVVVPIAQALRAPGTEGRLEKLTGGALRSVRVQSKMFERIAAVTVKTAINHRLASGDGERAVIISTLRRGGEVTTEITLQRLMRVLAPMHRERLTSASGDDGVIKATVGYTNDKKPTDVECIPHDCKSLHSVPGFEDENIAIAKAEDGSYRTLSKDENGRTVVTGRVPRWPSMPNVVGSWAISSHIGDRIAVYYVTNAMADVSADCKCDDKDGVVFRDPTRGFSFI